MIRHWRLQSPAVSMWRFDNMISGVWAYFHCACAETATWKLPVKNLTLPFAPARSIFYSRV